MIASIETFGESYSTDLSKPIDISIPLHPDGPRAWYVDKMTIEPVMTDRFTGSVAKGGAVNFRNIAFNPHGHGTHTETVGHIDNEIISINRTLNKFFFLAELLTIAPKPFTGREEEFKKHGDRIITQADVDLAIGDRKCEALIIRSVPNTDEKLSKNYSNTNPVYFEPGALNFMRAKGIKHLLTDLPSVDREEDGRKLLAHRAFWHGNRPDDLECTITEFIYVPDSVADGTYLLNLQIVSFENDASPSKPVLYKIEKE
ncbi:cyclase family protein [Cryomorpha ignava]|uniref:Cyclase family protein n=1 Tax=Cryomorpha ignava TaxID=101383 RepID=A0A7K3WSV3_9FLAO|nr:cyclase family protein [Cryomorpha ignava]NEN24564.1 cyclase family protein [Cryomorpha ignava]